jgi:hypothetical protein
MNRFWKTITSLRLTVALLACSVLLVFFGTLAQVDQGLWKAQQIWFRSFIVTMQHLRLFGLTFTVPLFPGGYLIGYTLLANLTAAFLKRFTWRWDKIGVHFTHAGVILLLLGQLLTDQLSTESHLRLKEGETRNFSEDHLKDELAFSIDTTDGKEHVVAIPEAMMKPGQEIKADDLPFTIRVKDYQVNSQLRRRGPVVDGPAVATQGVGTQLVAEKRPETTDMDSRNMPYAYIDLLKGGQSLGTWLVTPWLDLFETPVQDVTVDGKKYRLDFRSERYYKPFTVKLLKATHESYRGTEIPKNFKSRVRIADSTTGEAHEVDIYMNHPLRYAGLTFYQYQMGQDEMNRGGRETSTLQVVHNPGWLAPYAGCYIVAIGMFIQFRQHLTKFLAKRLGKSSLHKGGWGVWVARVAEIVIIGYAVLKFTMNLIGYNS